MCLDKTDLQKFFKRLRKYQEIEDNAKSNIKYYACGEYGTRTDRPHYHGIIFGASESSIERSWRERGILHFGDVNRKSIAYCCKYISKAVRKFDDKPSEFSVMSKGLGANYLTPAVKKWHSEGTRNYTLDGDIKTTLPRYYRERIFTESERLKIANQNQQLEQAKIDKLLKEHGNFKEINRVHYYRIKQQLSNHSKLQKVKRDKI